MHTGKAPQLGTPLEMWSAAMDYSIDAWQRSILFLDVMRQRGNQYREHRAKAAPHVLRFEAELIVDGRRLPRPANYGLVRVVPPEGVVVDEQKRPFVVVDPRAGHGPGIGGFKADSEIGVALRAGHPCYFVGFLPEPVPGQTIEDVMAAEAIFLEAVIARHPKAEGRPCVIGNCQAGWAIAMLAATRPELFGPLILAGVPLSYWAGVRGANPMRYTGGLLGGSWLAALMSDLGNGKFDGGWLVSNFESLDPANTLWSKQYNLWSRIDKEAPRYLEFERWWGGHVSLNADEIQFIVDQLFVGNRLSTAEIVTRDGMRIDLRSIRSPIVCFCSKGDNITPPQQALGWITDLYEKDEDILAHGQTIVYAIHESAGHLGIFVSGKVATKEHQEFASSIELIDVLPPGLYEAVMIPKTPEAASPDLVEGDWIVRFERRRLDDLRAMGNNDAEDERRFAAVRRVSEINLGLYRTFLQPWVRMFANETEAKAMHRLNPAELPFELISDANPFLRPVADLADGVRDQRRPVSADNPFVEMQAEMSRQIVALLDGWRDLRDSWVEQTFLAVYGSPLLQAAVGLRADDGPCRRHPGDEPEHLEFIRRRIEELKARMGTGDVTTAGIRALVYLGLFGESQDERTFAQLRKIREERGGAMTLAEFKDVLRDQFFMLFLDEERALASIPAMLPEGMEERGEIVEALRRVLHAGGAPDAAKLERLARIEGLFGVGQRPPARRTTAAEPGAGETQPAAARAAARKAS